MLAGAMTLDRDAPAVGRPSRSVELGVRFRIAQDSGRRGIRAGQEHERSLAAASRTQTMVGRRAKIRGRAVARRSQPGTCPLRRRVRRGRCRAHVPAELLLIEDDDAGRLAAGGAEKARGHAAGAGTIGAAAFRDGKSCGVRMEYDDLGRGIPRTGGANRGPSTV